MWRWVPYTLVCLDAWVAWLVYESVSLWGTSSLACAARLCMHSACMGMMGFLAG